jgi:hypothetical protein
MVAPPMRITCRFAVSLPVQLAASRLQVTRVHAQYRYSLPESPSWRDYGLVVTSLLEWANGQNAQNGIMYTLSGTEACWASGSPGLYYANVIFTCAETLGELTVSQPGTCIQN